MAVATLSQPNTSIRIVVVRLIVPPSIPVRDIALSTMDSLVAQVLQLIDLWRLGSDRFVLLPS